jgi:hypothetical protein
MNKIKGYSNTDDKIYKFRLEKQTDDSIHKPNERQFSFYQICQFPMDKMYSVRKLVYNEEAELLRYSEKKLKKILLDRFLKGSPHYKYTIHPSYDLKDVGFPNAGEILMARSQILNEY